MSDPTASPGGAAWPTSGISNMAEALLAAFGPSIYHGMPLQFNPTQNARDTMEGRRFQQTQMGAQMFAASNTGAGQQVGSTIGAINQMTGGHMSPLSNAQIGQVANAAMPYASTMGLGGLMDKAGFGGPGFAGGLTESQHPYTYTSSMTGQQAGAHLGSVATDAYNQLYGGDRGRQWGNTAGYGGTDTGKLLAAAQPLGWGPGNLMNMSESAATAATVAAAGPLTAAAAAVRDDRPENRKLNAQQTYGLLQAQNLGGIDMTPQQMGRNIRETKEISRLTDTAPEMMTALAQSAGQTAVALGGKMSEGVRAAQVGATAGGDGLAGAHASKLELQDKKAKLTVQAEHSRAGAQLAALLEAGDQGLIDKGSEAYKVYKQAKAGKYEYIPQGQFEALLVKGGMNHATAQALLADRETNIQRHHEDPNFAATAKGMQWKADIAPKMENAIASNLTTSSEHRISGARAQKAAAAVTQTIRDNHGSTPEQLQDAVEATLNQQGIRGKEAHQLAHSALSAANRSVQRQHQADNALQAAKLNVEGDDITPAAREEAAKKDADAAKGQKGPLARGMSVTAADVKKYGSIGAAARALGNVPDDTGTTTGKPGAAKGAAAAGKTGHMTVSVSAGTSLPVHIVESGGLAQIQGGKAWGADSHSYQNA